MGKQLTTRGHTRTDLRGSSIVPLLTPITSAGDLDEPTVRRHLDHVLTGGNQGVLVGGTTGEAPSMSGRARCRHVALAVEHSQGRALVFGGIGSNSLDEAADLAEAHFCSGADAVVAHLPSYFDLAPDEMESWLLALAGRVQGPIYLYNIPQATRLSLPIAVVSRLSEHPHIAGIKDSEPDAARQVQIAKTFQRCDDFVVYVGSVPFASIAFRAGADGFVPSAGNIAPDVTRRLMDALVAGNASESDALQQRLGAISALYQRNRTLGQSIAAMKCCISLQGFGTPNVMPPLQPVSPGIREALRESLEQLGLMAPEA